MTCAKSRAGSGTSTGDTLCPTILDRQLIAAARHSPATKLLMTIPGTGAITAVSYAAAIEDPDNFRTSRSVGAWLGLTTRRYQSGEVDYDGHISRRGDNRLRGLLYEAATAMLTRTSAKNESRLKDWVPIPMKPPLCSEMIAPPVSGMISPPV